MNKKHPTPEELRRMEYEFSEYKDEAPQELVNALEKAFEILRPYFTMELPMYNELLPVIEKLIYKQYPSLSSYAFSWPARWISEIIENTSQDLATDLSSLFEDFATGVNRTELYDDFESVVAFYTLPMVAYQIEMPNYEGEPFWEQEKEGIRKELKEENEERKVDCERHNRLKKEFILAVQPIIIKYFGQQTDIFTTEMWQHYGIALGSAYLEYSDNCYDLEYIFEVDELTNDPEIGFYEYNRRLSARILERFDNLNSEDEPINS